jgi:hypothetical protein
VSEGIRHLFFVIQPLRYHWRSRREDVLQIHQKKTHATQKKRNSNKTDRRLLPRLVTGRVRPDDNVGNTKVKANELNRFAVGLTARSGW